MAELNVTVSGGTLLGLGLGLGLETLTLTLTLTRYELKL